MAQASRFLRDSLIPCNTLARARTHTHTHTHIRRFLCMITWIWKGQRDRGVSGEPLGDYKGTETTETATKCRTFCCTIDILHLMHTAAGLRPQDEAKQSKAKQSPIHRSKAMPHPQKPLAHTSAPAKLRAIKGEVESRRIKVRRKGCAGIGVRRNRRRNMRGQEATHGVMLSIQTCSKSILNDLSISSHVPSRAHPLIACANILQADRAQEQDKEHTKIHITVRKDISVTCCSKKRAFLAKTRVFACTQGATIRIRFIGAGQSRTCGVSYSDSLLSVVDRRMIICFHKPIPGGHMRRARCQVQSPTSPKPTPVRSPHIAPCCTSPRAHGLHSCTHAHTHVRPHAHVWMDGCSTRT